MALPYRPIRAAPPKADAVLSRTPVKRAVSKRSGIIKSACLECRKRKAKCNGKKPVCVSCSKYDRECVYDSDIRESRVRGLQNANEKLEEELDAAKLLLKQMANGSAELRDDVSELLDQEKQPSEIIELLKNGRVYDHEIPQADDNRTSRNSNDPIFQKTSSDISGIGHPHPFPVEEFEYSITKPPTMQQEESSSNEDSCVMMESENCTTEHSTYMSNEQLTERRDFNAPSCINSGEDTTPDSSQPFYSQPSMFSTTESLVDQLPAYENNYGRTTAHQAERRSLFFQPLFNHNDYYLSTSITTPIPQEITDLGTGNEDLNLAGAMQDVIVDEYLPTQPDSQVHEGLGDTSLRTDPSYKNHFGNLALSNSIRANGYPRHIQDAQIRNIFLPSWAATTLNTELDPGDMSNAFGDIYQQATSLLKKGEPVNRVIGDHPNIAALYDQHQFDRSCLLSQWAARMVHSVKCQGYDFTCFASMNVFWYMMRWMINPSPETYAAMPEWIRPTTNQLFTPHISMADFVLWPAFRDLVVQLPQLQERMAWLADMSMHIRCEWPYALEDALKPDPVNGTIDLTDLAKEHVWSLGSWSVGPSFRNFVMNADAYLQIRNGQ
ncbi:hypothetical protein NOF04DRAFT_14387 [Fusarium oxysporum II5]|uniref:Zn(2)-C6 fungal-type domain-containing protein n=1 Tax=Fusarium odoratissimum (strain NRRL 54006) TaxID=1089451 RepID=X0J9F0_FUSO5|nr:uncharacterized protein FOIG_14158 [Fusarium odoratissimum NRRL 54006]EXL92991.1 hypothetical protein FOIG_14158 [Fusarium odoratissimum NRRL 54006]KAK2123203.1 hypothetical protein NOF04DRAFT_14387 [Fusarium oxysporum II5]